MYLNPLMDGVIMQTWRNVPVMTSGVERILYGTMTSQKKQTKKPWYRYLSLRYKVRRSRPTVVPA